MTLLLVVAGCGPIAEPCHPGTLLLVVTLDTATVAANSLAVTLSLGGKAGKMSSVPHVPGYASGNIEVAFPNGYPRGRTIDVVVQALDGTDVLGTGTASQLLTASCEATPLAVHGNGADGGADMVTEPPPDLTTLVDQALPVDLTPPPGDMTCIPVAETGDNCFDGIDNDCDGKIDCADSDCTNAQCVPPVSAPFSIGIVVDQASFCPALYTSLSLLDSGLNGGSCTTTSCTCTGVESCSADTTSYPSASCSGESDDNSAASTCRNFDVSAPTKGVSVGNITASGGTCSPGGTSAKPTPTWTTQDRFCATASRGGGCTGGMLCVPKLAVQTCEVANEVTACDPGYSAVAGSWFTGYSDGRSCSCSCGAASGGSCGTSVGFYTGASCGGTLALTLAASTQSCSAPGTPYASLKIVGGTAPTCGAPGATVSGTPVAGTGAQTYCCLP